MSWTELLNNEGDNGTSAPKGKIWMTRLLLFLLRPLLRWYFPLHVTGRELIPDDRNVLFAANHQSYLDPVFISCAMGSGPARNTCYLAKDKHFQSRFKRWFAASTRVMLIAPRVRLREMMARLGQILQSGSHLIIFPEGTRTPDGQIQEFKKTFALLAETTGTPIMPVLIQGAFEAFPTGQKKPLRKPVHVQFLPLIETEAVDARTLTAQVEETLRNAMLDN